MRLFLGDCMDHLKNIPTASIDLVVTDCPYHITAGGVSLKYNAPHGILDRRIGCSNKWVKLNENGIPRAMRQGKIFENNSIEFSRWLPEVFRVLKDGTHCYIMINSRNLKELQVEAEKAGFRFVNLLAWKKNNATPNRYYMQCLEFILMLRKGGARSINSMGTTNCLEVPNIIGKKVHPTEKPVELMEILIANSTDPGDTVLDPFMGGGSTGMACRKLRREFVGMEIDEGYFETARKRIEEFGESDMDDMALFRGVM